jgi:transcriptional regulator with XRE-family HTH domain
LHKANALLKQAREAAGWTQAQLAEQIGCPSGVAISRWESGSVVPSLYYRGKLCTVFQKTPQELGLLLSEESDEASRSGLVLPEPVFFYRVPLPHPNEFYGRIRERQRLVTRTLQKGSTSITGPRRIGKTWLASYMRFVVLNTTDTSFRFGYLDAMSPKCWTVSGFTAEALRVLGLPTSSAQPDLSALVDGLHTLLDQKVTPILCIDEFEAFGEQQEFTPRFFSGLRAMTQTQNLTLIVISRDTLRAIIEHNSQGSRFINIFEEIRLKKFNHDDAAQFIEAKGQAAGFTLQEQEQYLWYGGREDEHEEAWIPQRLQFAGRTLLGDLHQARFDPNYIHMFKDYMKDEFGE